LTTDKETSNKIKDLKSTAARGAGWGILLGSGARAIGLISSIFLTHLLSPDMVGEVALAYLVVAISSYFSTLGYGNFILAKANEKKDTIWHVTIIHVVLGIIVLGCVFLFRARIGHLINAPGLVHYIPWFIFILFIDRLFFVPERVLTKNLQLKKVAMTRSVSEVMYSFFVLGFAAVGFGGMSIIYGNIIRSSFRFGVYITSVPLSEWLTPYKLSLKKYKEILHFSLPIAASSWINFAAARVDNVIFSILYGPAMMAQYNVAYNLADAPADQIGDYAAEALLPALAKLKREDRPSLALFAVSMLSLIIFPVAIGMGLVATTAADTFIGDKWHNVGSMLMILSILSITRPLSWQANAYFMANSSSRLMFLFELAKLISIVVMLFTVGRISPNWACIAVGFAFIAHTFAAQWSLSRSENIKMRRWLSRSIRPLLACIPLTIFVLLSRFLYVKMGFHIYGINLIIEIIAGAIGYAGGVFLFAHHQAFELIGLIRESRHKT
jgi:lipopolysaccharide exporter